MPAYYVHNIKIRLVGEVDDDIIGYAGLSIGIWKGGEGDIYLNDIAIKRRHGTGERFIDFPKSWGGGTKHAVWKPANNAMYEALRKPIIEALDKMIEGAKGGR